MPEWLCPYKEGSLLRLYIQPGARTSGITGIHDGRLKVKISSPPRDGEANREVISFISKTVGVTKGEVEILRGESGRSKDVYVNLPPEKVLTYLKVPS